MAQAAERQAAKVLEEAKVRDPFSAQKEGFRACAACAARAAEAKDALAEERKAEARPRESRETTSHWISDLSFSSLSHLLLI